jgi:hypothetical protein
MVIWNDNGLATRGAIDGFFFITLQTTPLMKSDFILWA